MPDALAPFRWLAAPPGTSYNPLGDVFCVAFFHGLEPAEVAARFDSAETPARSMTFGELDDRVTEFIEGTDGGCGGGYVGVTRIGEWSVVIEPYGWHITLSENLACLSRGCEAVAVGRHDYADHRFMYAVDGEIVTAFTPHVSAKRWGSDHDRLREPMRRVGLPLTATAGKPTWDTRWDDALPKAFALAATITGVTLSADSLAGPLLVASVAQWAQVY
ncbi:hypothetical protein GCM10010116_25540 [Microbispora rosea subsp. aerata]|nr:DUF6461 domain-containing protein [Microbispora rosea]GGO12713.1 hypothetical protein GCM10010116_25540 [Microbispora rosea subsp. aerata]GIH54116.1 hypothetical protein Mro02_10300 [Microbispora rosea subsp. aerata]GLJ85089.1 hypothetical protein GCM10017588_38170 [Microbispora rosea subsp. aerata]